MGDSEEEVVDALENALKDWEHIDDTVKPRYEDVLRGQEN